MIVGMSVVALAGVALAQPILPDQGAAPAASHPNMGDGAGAGPAGSIGDPNGAGPGAAAPSHGPGSEPALADRAVQNGPTVSKSDAIVLKSCLAMPREKMSGIAICRALMIRQPDLFK